MNKKEHIKLYTCPMHPEIQREAPGMCPECGMQLVPIQRKQEKESHDTQNKHAGHSTAMFLRKFWISTLLSIPVVLYSGIMGKLFGVHVPSFPGSIYIPFVLGSVVFFYGGMIFLAGAVREIKGRMPGMMTLIAIAITAAYLWSVYATFAEAEPLFWELTTLIVIMLLGHWIEMRAVSGVQSALKELSKLLPDTTDVIRDGAPKTILLSELHEHDTVLVKPGANIPADGIVLEGESEINESLVTGESKPVLKKHGNEVIAGTTNGDGVLKISVAKIGEKTFLAGVMRLVEEAQLSKSRLQLLSDKAAFYLTCIAVVSSLMTLAAWLIAGADLSFAVARLVAVLVIACPHALGLAVPLVASISTTKAAQNGFLIKQRLALESARTVTTVLFDKTGTLTKGEFGVVGLWPLKGISDNEVLTLAASIDAWSEHPIARAIVQKARETKLSLKEPKNFLALKGRGAQALLDGNKVQVGGPALLTYNALSIPPEINQYVQNAGIKGQTVIYVIRNKAIIGALALADMIRDESKEALQALKAMGIKTAMMTGDSEEVAQWVSNELGIDEYFARVLPQQKTDKVKALQQSGAVVAMVGDGINDAPALSQADIGIAIGAGTNVAIESAGIILAKNDPRDIVKIIKLSRLTYTKMIQNLFWATGYNILALPLAAGALAFKGILLQPAAAAILMSFSTIIVAFNAMLLKNKSL